MFLGRLAGILHLIFWVENGNADTATSCWTSGNWSCLDPQPYLLVGLRNVILRTDLDGGSQKQLVSGVGNGVLMDFHYREQRVYWVDTHTGVLSRVDWDGTHTQKLLFLGKGISGLAVDWRENMVYWSSRKSGTIQQADTDGHHIKTVLRDLTQPSSVVIDPNAGFVFWLSASVVSSIHRSDLSGGSISTVLRTPDRLLSLAADAVEMKLFWIQHNVEELDSLGSCGYNGDFVNGITQRLGRTKSSKMSLFSGYVFMTDSASQSVLRVNMHTGEPPEKVSTKSMKMPSVPVDVKVIYPTNRPAAGNRATLTQVCETEGCVNVCSSSTGGCKCKPGFRLSQNGDCCEDVNECALWNHGCSLGCENLLGSYYCTCPEGYALLSDHRTCREMQPCVENGTLCEHACTHTLEGDVCVCPVDSSLEPDGRSCTGCVSADRGGCSQVCLTLSPGRWECVCQPGYQLQPDGKQCKASGPSALLLFANMVDVRSVNVDGSESRSLINGSKHSIVFVDHDPVQNKVYFDDTERSRIESVSVHGVERSGASRPISETPPTVTTPWRRGNVVEICPSSHESYCLHNAVCFYIPEIETYACNCVPGYMGERCQYTDLEWWDLQQAEQEKRRNAAIAVCISLLFLTLTITASITCCYRYRRCTGRRAAVEVVSEASVCEEIVTETPSVGLQFYVLLNHRMCDHEKILHLVGSQRRGVCPCCSSKTGESVVSEDSETQNTLVDLVDGGTSETCVKLGVNLISLDDSHTPSLI